MGIRIERRFTAEIGGTGRSVHDMFEWESRSSRITAADGRVLYEGSGDVPSGWGQIAVDVLLSKYARRTQVGEENGHETSARQIFDRLSGTWRAWAEDLGYFETADDAAAFQDEITWMLAAQYAAPNSPQWFNTGLHEAYGITGPPQGHWTADPETGECSPCSDAFGHPQVSACYIQSVGDDLVNPGGIMDLWVREARVFKYGSGSGSNVSAIRAEGEPLAGGGTSSGLLSFLKVGDSAAGAIKSGGTTRRAAKMVVLDLDHPEIEAFVDWKAGEERKAGALMEAGWSGGLDGDAYRTVSGQNANLSVRVPEHFFELLASDGDWQLLARVTGEPVQRIRARALWERIAQAAWACADPGVQYETTINDWHTCPGDGPIRASNPCAEHLFLDDTACNLASLNLVRFLGEDGTFDVEAFRHAARLWTVVLDVSAIKGGYPSEVLARRAWEYRNLGLGYTNLGSLLMRLGLGYDSDEGRGVCGAITAVLTGAAYATSAELAGELGPFPRFAANRDPMLRVVRNHRRAAYGAAGNDYEGLAVAPVGLPQAHVPEALLRAAHDAWDRALAAGERNGFRNAQISCLAPAGTISLVMDCDTTGIEPEFSLVKLKKLSGGGHFKIANRAIAPALRRLGYDGATIDGIIGHVLGSARLDHPVVNRAALRAKGLTDADVDAVEEVLPACYDLRSALVPWVIGEAAMRRLGLDPADVNADVPSTLGFTDDEIEAASRHVCGHHSVEGAPGLDPQHLPVFDCANPCGDGTRHLAPEAHLLMMAVAQPLLSGGISKTVNQPHSATVADIAAVYERGHELGLKAVAVYRDGSKLTQPLTSRHTVSRGAAEDGGAEEPEGQEELTGAISRTLDWNPFRRKLPVKRTGWTYEGRIGGQKVFIRTGEYEDGTIGVLFIDIAKEGATLRSMANAFAVAVSKGLQYGVPLEEFVDTFVFTRFDPAGPVQGHPSIKMTTSILDYTFRVLGVEYLGRTDLAQVPPTDLPAPAPARVGDDQEPGGSPAKAIPAATAARTETERDDPGRAAAPTPGRKTPPRPAEAGVDAPACAVCGHLMIRTGTCFECTNCGTSLGCS